MSKKPPPIGFEKVLQPCPTIGWNLGNDQEIDDNQNANELFYPIQNRMPSLNPSLDRTNVDQFYMNPNNYPLMSQQMPISNMPINGQHSMNFNQISSSPQQYQSSLNNSSSHSSHHSSSNSLSSSMNKPKRLTFLQVIAIYNEITNVWPTEKWLTFMNSNTDETFLTLNCPHSMTIQMAIDRHYLLTKKQYLSKLPERLLIKNSQQNPEIFITPNSTISLENLFLNENDTGNVVTYKLMAIICGNNPDMMFYREPTTDYWYFYRNEAEQATLSVRLSDENKKLLDSLIQEEIHPITNLYGFDKSLATIFTTPQFYVYQPVI